MTTATPVAGEAPAWSGGMLAGLLATLGVDQRSWLLLNGRGRAEGERVMERLQMVVDTR